MARVWCYVEMMELVMRVRCSARGCLFCYCWLDFDTISSVHRVPFVCTFDVNYCGQMSKRSPQQTAERCWSKSRRRDIQEFFDFRISLGLLYSGMWRRVVRLKGSMVSKWISASIIMGFPTKTVLLIKSKACHSVQFFSLCLQHENYTFV